MKRVSPFVVAHRTFCGGAPSCVVPPHCFFWCMWYVGFWIVDVHVDGCEPSGHVVVWSCDRESCSAVVMCSVSNQIIADQSRVE